MTIATLIGVNPLQTTETGVGIVSSRVALLLRSAEIQPFSFDLFGSPPKLPWAVFARGRVSTQHGCIHKSVAPDLGRTVDFASTRLILVACCTVPLSPNLYTSTTYALLHYFFYFHALTFVPVYSYFSQLCTSTSSIPTYPLLARHALLLLVLSRFVLLLPLYLHYKLFIYFHFYVLTSMCSLLCVHFCF